MITNTEKVRIHMAILKWGDSYLGISKELGLVEEAETAEEVKTRLTNGSSAVLSTIVREGLNIEDNLAVRPPLKYYLIYLISPLLIYFSDNVVSLFTALLDPLKLPNAPVLQ